MEQPPRRSHASLKHLSLSPLTPSYPLPPTSPSPPLHTSMSHSYLASPTYPSTPTVLSRSPSRTCLRPNHVGPQPINTSLSSPSLPKTSSRPAHHKRASVATVPTSASLSMSAITSPTRKQEDEESSWFLRTASTLQSQRMEEKGQAWLATRNSSTSLALPTTSVDDLADDEFSPYPSTYAAPESPDWPRSPFASRSRVQSRYASRVPSRLGSQMQSRAGSAANLREDGLRALTSAGHNRLKGEGEVGKDIIGPDFVDPAVFEDEALIGDEEEVDEGEMKRVIMGRAKGWIDWAVGWMDLRGEEEIWEGSDDDEKENRDAKGNGRGNTDERRRRKQESLGLEDGADKSGEAVELGPPPQDRDAGAMADAKWLLNVASKLIV